MNSSDLKWVLLLLAGIGVFGWWRSSHQHGRPFTGPAITGRAVDVRGDGVSGARIDLWDDSGRVVAHTTSGDDGRFNMTGCGPGQYRVIASKDGVGGGERSVTLGSKYGAETQVSLDGLVRRR